LKATLDHAYSWQWATRATYAMGGAAVATSIALLYLNRERIVRERRLDGVSDTSLSPMLVPHGAGMSATMRF
jgi:hypothetical protein